MDRSLTNGDLQALQALYDWYEALGVDFSVGEKPTDWFALSRELKARAGDEATDTTHTIHKAEADGPTGVRQTAGARQRQQTTAPPAGPVPGRPLASGMMRREAHGGSRHRDAPEARGAPPAAEPQESVMTARELAREAKDLDELHARLAGFDGCRLKVTARSLCFYRGAPEAPLMIIGEAPGRDEDIQGKPFVGRAGQLLDKMLAAIDLDESRVHITNIVYWRPPGNRNPTPEEAAACRPFLERQIALVRPKVILLLGKPATNHMLGVSDGIMRLRGKWREVAIEGRAIPALPSLHPAYLLRNPSAKRLAWRDLLAVRQKLDEQEKSDPSK